MNPLEKEKHWPKTSIFGFQPLVLGSLCSMEFSPTRGRKQRKFFGDAASPQAFCVSSRRKALQDESEKSTTALKDADGWRLVDGRWCMWSRSMLFGSGWSAPFFFEKETEHKVISSFFWVNWGWLVRAKHWQTAVVDSCLWGRCQHEADHRHVAESGNSKFWFVATVHCMFVLQQRYMYLAHAKNPWKFLTG